VKLEPGETVVRLKPEEFAQLKVQHPKLWWPNGYGEPALHTLKVSFTAGGKLSAQRQIDFGMREVSYETSLFDSTGHLRRVEVLPSRTHDEALPLIDEPTKASVRLTTRRRTLLPEHQPGQQHCPIIALHLGAVAGAGRRGFALDQVPSRAAGRAPIWSSRSTACALPRAAATGAWTTAANA
jgi:hypothetical protein